MSPASRGVPLVIDRVIEAASSRHACVFVCEKVVIRG